MRTKQKLWILISTLALVPQVLLCDEYDQVKVLEDQRYSRTGRFSLDVDLASMPLDAYYKPMMAEVTANYQFSDLFSWNFLRGGYAVYNVNTGLQKAITDQTHYTYNQPPIFKKTKYFLASEASLNLFYGKLNMLNQGIVYSQISLFSGPMLIDFDRKKQIGADIGMKIEFFVNDTASVHFKVGHTIGFLGGAPSNIMILDLGVGFAF